MYNNVFGAIMSPKDIRDYQMIACGTVEIPEEFELQMCKVKNQGQVGSCVAHSLSSIIEYFNKIQNNEEIEMSTGFIYGNRRETIHKQPGLVMRDAIKTVCKYGDVTKEEFPDNIEVPYAIQKFEAKYNQLEGKGVENKFTSYYRLGSAVDIKESLMLNGPVTFAIYWYSDIIVDNNGIMRSDKNINTAQGGHCMTIYGWNKQGWKIQNSWGTDFGKDGKAIMPYDFPICEAWAIIDTEVKQTKQLNIKKPYKSKFKQVIAKIINKIVNLWLKIFRKQH